MGSKDEIKGLAKISLSYELYFVSNISAAGVVVRRAKATAFRCLAVRKQFWFSTK